MVCHNSGELFHLHAAGHFSLAKTFSSYPQPLIDWRLCQAWNPIGIQESMEYSIGVLDGVLLRHFWSTFGVLLGHFWSTFGVLLEYFMGNFGVLLEYFWALLGHFWSTLRFHGMIS